MSKNVIWSKASGKVKVPRETPKWLGQLVSRNVVELRKTFSSGGNFAQVLIQVGPGLGVKMSMNGKAAMSLSDIKIMHGAIIEANIKLQQVEKEDARNS